ncbi:MAG: dicarboxylate/amino acid:cation symporter [Bacteroidales bacterium]|nr:dicarboxylate/amino acid:cation symporter [Bacteroidales bacterium]
MPLYAKILIGMALGIALGLLGASLHFETFIHHWVGPWGTIFIRLLKLIAVPLVLVSLIIGVVNLKDIRNLSRIGLKTILIYICTTVIAVSIGLAAVSLVEPGQYFPKDKQTEFMQRYEQTVTQREADMQQVQDQSPLQFLVDMVPDNAFVAFGDNSKMLQIIFFALLFGVAVVCVGTTKAGSIVKFFNQLNLVLLKIIDFIMAFAPIGVFALMADLIVTYSGDVGIFSSLGLYALTVILALAFISFVIYPVILKLFTKKPLKDFYKAAFPVQMLAFSTSSSAATLPLTMERTQKNLGVSEEVSSFVLPVGVTINMDGTSCYQAVAAVFLAQVLGLDLTFGQMLLILATATISSIGTPGIPGGSIVMLMIVLDAVGIPIEGLALILGVDRPLDMLRTVVNVTGDMTVASVVDGNKNVE